jgi:hypothetical protein
VRNVPEEGAGVERVDPALEAPATHAVPLAKPAAPGIGYAALQPYKVATVSLVHRRDRQPWQLAFFRDFAKFAEPTTAEEIIFPGGVQAIMFPDPFLPTGRPEDVTFVSRSKRYHFKAPPDIIERLKPLIDRHTGLKAWQRAVTRFLNVAAMILLFFAVVVGKQSPSTDPSVAASSRYARNVLGLLAGVALMGGALFGFYAEAQKRKHRRT